MLQSCQARCAPHLWLGPEGGRGGVQRRIYVYIGGVGGAMGEELLRSYWGFPEEELLEAARSAVMPGREGSNLLSWGL